jgi:hypothetical protein
LTAKLEAATFDPDGLALGESDRFNERTQTLNSLSGSIPEKPKVFRSPRREIAGHMRLKEAWDRGDRDQFLVDTLEEPIRYTEGKKIGIKR